MPQQEVPQFVRDDLESLGFELPEPMLDQLAAYLARLLEANRQMNLTAVRETDAAWRTLIVDSLSPLPWFEALEAGASVIDVGTGGGLPGIPLAITRPDLRFTLLDSTAKKIRFLNEVTEAFALNHVSPIQHRAELLGHDSEHRQRFQLVIGRAVGAIRVFLEYALPLATVGGTVLAMKGPKAEQELRDAGDSLDALGGGEVQVFDAYPATFANELVIVRVEKARPTPKDYPRAPGVPRRAPL